MKKWIRLDKLGQLYISDVLVHFDIPLLFVCHDEKGEKYLVECINEIEGAYLISPITDKWLQKLLSKEETMGKCLKQNEEHVLIKIKFSSETNKFTEEFCKSSSLIADELPDEGAYLDYAEKH